MNNATKLALQSAKQIQDDVYELFKPPAEAEKPKTNYVVDFTLIKDTRGYLERVTHQINGSYQHGWYDACAVMLRRLIETLIIEVFEYHSISSKIKNTSGDYVMLKDLIPATLNETTWSLGRKAKQALPKLKDIGDQSAHSRRFNAYRADIENLLPEIRIVIQELTSLANLK